MTGSSTLENVVGLPERAEVRHLAAHHAGDGGRLQSPHSASSPVSSTNTSSSDAARRIASGGHGAVGGLLRADDRDRRPGRAHPQPLRLGLRAHLGEPLGRRVHLGGLAAGVLGDRARTGFPRLMIFPWAITATSSASRSASSM